jgi:tripartite-type tricarboxylate transporter receptor subunit TctC
MRVSRRALVAGALSSAVVSGRSYGAPADFYRGNKVRLLVGTTPGAGYDLIARLLGAHISKFIPGNPSVIVENVPGAGSLTMMNYLSNRAPRDGSVLGLPLNGILLEPTLKLMSRTGGAVSFDIAKLNWIGSTSEEPQVLWFLNQSNVRTIDDLRTLKSNVGASSPGADNFTVATLTNQLLGAKMAIVRGYQGTQPIFLAAERGEVEGSATAYGAIAVAKGDWIRDKKIRMLVQYGTERIDDLPDVPTAVELADNAEAKEMFGFFAIKFKAAYPFVMPPEVPADRLSAVRSAFDQTVKDADFLAGMRKAGLSVKPTSGPEIEKLVQSTYKVPQQTLDKLRSLIG